MTNARDKANIPVLNFQSKGITVSDTNTAFVYVEENTGDAGDTAGILFKTSSADGFFKSGMILEDDGTHYAKGKLHIVQNSESNNNNATVSDAKITILNDGKVGIGDTAPQDFLEINGSGRGLGGLTISNSTHHDAALSFARSDGATARIYTVEPGSTHTSKLNFQTSDASGSAPNLLTAMVIDHNQNVGIGTTSPSRTLSVFDSTPIVALYNSTTGTGNSDGFQFQLSSDDGYLWNYESGGNVIFGAGGSERLRITNEGRIGIGSSSPGTHDAVLIENGQSYLTITDPQQSGFKIKSDDTAVIYVYDRSSDAITGGITFAHNDGTMDFKTNGNNNRMRIDSSGNLLLNTTSQVSGAKFSVNGGIGIDRTSTYNQQWVQYITHTGSSNYGTLYIKPQNGQSTAGLLIEDAAGNNRFQIRGSGDSTKETVVNQSGGDFDFRVESNNNTHMLFVDGGQDRIGIGESAPLGKFHITSLGSGASVSDTDDLIIENGTSGAASGISILSATNGYGNICFGDSGDNNIGVFQYDHNSNFMRFIVNASERLRITDAGRVGIGESSPDNTLHVNSTSSTVTKFERDSGSNGSLTIGFPSTRTNLEASGDMRLTATRVLINKSSPGSLTNAEVIVDHDGSSTYGIRLNSSSTSGTQYHQSFDRGESQAGYITSNSATTIAFNNASDERLKENIQNSGSAIQDIKDIKVRQFDWKDGIDTHRDFGFVAQELVNVVPEAVSQGTDELNDNGKPIRSWGVDYSHIVPRLVKVCQEQQTKIETLEAEVTALKNQP